MPIALEVRVYTIGHSNKREHCAVGQIEDLQPHGFTDGFGVGEGHRGEVVGLEGVGFANAFQIVLDHHIVLEIGPIQLDTVTIRRASRRN